MCNTQSLLHNAIQKKKKKKKACFANLVIAVTSNRQQLSTGLVLAVLMTSSIWKIHTNSTIKSHIYISQTIG
jgi:hypothetical protein